MEINEDRRKFLIKSGKILGGLFLSSSLNLIYPKKAFPNDSIFLSWFYKDVDGENYFYRIFFKDNFGSGVLPSEKIYHDEYCFWEYPDNEYSHICEVRFDYPFSKNLVYEFWTKAYNDNCVGSADSNHVSAECSSGYWKEYSSTGGGGRTPTGGGSRSFNKNNIENFLALKLENSNKTNCLKSVGIDRFFS
jgi:hypothetical protein